MTGFLKSDGRRRYRCNRPRWQVTDGTPCGGSVHADQLESQVWHAVERVLRDPELIATEVARRQHSTETQQQEIDREQHLIREALARCDRDLKRWEDAYLGEAITLQDFKGKRAEIDARRASLHAERTRLEEHAQQIEQERSDAALLVEYCHGVTENLERLDIPTQRQALEALNIIVTWEPGKPLHIQGSIPIDTASNTL